MIHPQERVPVDEYQRTLGIRLKNYNNLFAICTSPMIIHLICLPKFCIRTVFNFSWDGCKIQEKLDDKALQNLVGVKGGGGWGANELYVQMANTRLFLHLHKRSFATRLRVIPYLPQRKGEQNTRNHWLCCKKFSKTNSVHMAALVVHRSLALVSDMPFK